MASHWFITLAIVAIVLPAVAMATEYTVGGDDGWTTEYDYVTWAKDKVFRVGDALVFKYTPPQHDVIKVNGTEFNDCIPSKWNTPLISGNDVINLSTPGKKWYICGKGSVIKHCDLGQKLVIDVVSDAPAPSPTPSGNKPPPPSGNNPPPPSGNNPPPPSGSNAASEIMSSGSPVIVAAVVLMALIMV